MPDDTDLPLPPPPPDAAGLTLARVRGLLARGGDVGYVLEVALAAALAKGQAALDRYRWGADVPATAEEARRRFLEALQAAEEELDRIALGVAEGEKAEG